MLDNTMVYFQSLESYLRDERRFQSTGRRGFFLYPVPYSVEKGTLFSFFSSTFVSQFQRLKMESFQKGNKIADQKKKFEFCYALKQEPSSIWDTNIYCDELKFS